MKTNKEAAVDFLQLVVKRKIHEAYQKYVHPDMQHHNVYFAGDATSLEKAMEESHAKFPNTVLEIKHVLGDGDLVAVHSHVRMTKDQLGVGVVHLFRFANNKIVEMWDVGQSVPETSPNKNGMF